MNPQSSLVRLATETGLMLLAFGPALALGGVHRPTIGLAATLALLTLLALWLYRRDQGRQLRVPWFGALLLGATAYTALQLLPLPRALLEAIAPASVDAIDLSYRAIGRRLGWHPISLDPGATLWEVLKIGTCALAFIVSHNYMRRAPRRFRLLAGFAGVGVLLSMLGILGAVAAPGKALLFYKPHMGSGAAFVATSFVNPNHSAAFLLLCALCALGLAVSQQDLQWRAFLCLAAVAIGGVVLLTLSRGGILALAAGIACFALLMLTRHGPTEAGRRHALAVIGSVLALIVALGAWLGQEAIVEEFAHLFPEQRLELGKIGLWSSGVRMVIDNPWVGVGRGAFLSAFPRYIDASAKTSSTYSHLENQYLHLPAEWGVPVAAMLIAAAITALWRWLRRGDSPPLAAIGAGLIALGLHNLVDFNLEVLGVALPVAVLAGAMSAAAGERSRTQHVLRSRGHPMNWFLAGAAALIAVTLLVAVISDRPSRIDDDRELATLLTSEKLSFSEVKRRAAAVIARRPADHAPHLIVARRALREGRPEAVRWLNRAMQLFPRNPSIHLETASALRRFGRRRQALIECRLAMESGAKPFYVLRWVMPLVKEPADLDVLLTSDPAMYVKAIRRLLANRRAQLARKVALAARKRWRFDEELAIVEVETLIGVKDKANVLDSARELAKRRPAALTYLLWGRAAAVAGKLERKVEILREGRKRYPGDMSIAFHLSDALLKTGKIDRARETAEQMLRQAIKLHYQAQAHDLLARIHKADGRLHRARYEREQARRLRRGQ